MIKKRQLKIIFTGSVGAGKTHAIAAISDVPVISTETNYTEGDGSTDKTTTTVGMDYGQLSLSPEVTLHLYGTPGQRRFDFMSEVLSIGGLALIIMINNSAPDPFADLEYYLNLNKKFLKNNPAVIALTHYDVSSLPLIFSYKEFLAEKGLYFSVITMDARCRESIIDVLEEVVNLLEGS